MREAEARCVRDERGAMRKRRCVRMKEIGDQGNPGPWSVAGLEARCDSVYTYAICCGYW
jgi:hypothetical protein